MRHDSGAMSTLVPRGGLFFPPLSVIDVAHNVEVHRRPQPKTWPRDDHLHDGEDRHRRLLTADRTGEP